MSRLDSRTWLVWGVCCMIPMLIGRHPLLVLTMLGIVLTVRYIAMPPGNVRWSWIIRISVIFASVGVLINALTVRSGNQIAFHLPWTDWAITWNAIAYGIVSGIAMVTLVITGITTAAGLNWIALTRVLPSRMAPLAVSGSVAWSFLPAASQAFSDIRESQAARGHQIRSARDVLPIIVPLLDGSLGRALTMSEALEVRGFGAASNTSSGRTFSQVFGMVAVLAALTVAVAISMNAQLLFWLSLVALIIGVFGFLAMPERGTPTTRYREHHLSSADIGVMVGAIASLTAVLLLATTNFDSLIFNPYPNLEVPAIDYRLLLALIPLLGPALFPYEGSSR